MNLDWLQSIIFGLISGLTEFLPVSSQAHQALMMKLFGGVSHPLMRFFIHTAVLLALYQSCAEQIGPMLREWRLKKLPPRKRKRQLDLMKILDIRLLRTGTILVLLGFVFYQRLSAWQTSLNILAVTLAVNGIILLIPMYLPYGNKDSRSMSQLDAILLGLAGAASVLPGISRVGILTSTAIARGADREHALRWSFLLCIPALLCLAGFDIYSMIAGGIGALTVGDVVRMLLSAVAAYGGAWGGIQLMRFMAVRVGFSGFSYYCWGAALFSFLMYLTV